MHGASRAGGVRHAQLDHRPAFLDELTSTDAHGALGWSVSEGVGHEVAQDLGEVVGVGEDAKTGGAIHFERRAPGGDSERPHDVLHNVADLHCAGFDVELAGLGKSKLLQVVDQALQRALWGGPCCD